MSSRRVFDVLRSRRRDPEVPNYGTYMVVDLVTNTIVAGDTNSGFGWSLDDVAEFLKPQEVGHLDSFNKALVKAFAGR